MINDAYIDYKIDAITIYKQLGIITKSNKPLPKHLKNYITDSESLKPYIGFYKPKDSTDKNILIINEKGMFYNTRPYIYRMFNHGNDKFGFSESLTYSLTFQRDDKEEITGVNFNANDYKREYVKIDSKKNTAN